MKPDSPTRLDRLLIRVKDHRVLMWVILLSIVVVGIGQISDALAKIRGLLARQTSTLTPGAKIELAHKELRKAGIKFTAKSLVEASRGGDYETTRLLLEAGLNPNAKAQGLPGTALGYAAQLGHAEIASLLLASGADMSATSVGLTPLMLAAYSGEGEIVHLLLDHGAPVDGRGIGSNTALMAAAQGCQRFTAGTLLDAGADPNLRDENGLTALMLAAEGCREDRYELKSFLILLVKNGADLEARDNEGATVLDVVKHKGLDDIERLVDELKVLQSSS